MPAPLVRTLGVGRPLRLSRMKLRRRQGMLRRSFDSGRCALRTDGVDSRYFSLNSTQPRVLPKSMLISHFLAPVWPK
jgi:hypothetical protein